MFEEPEDPTNRSFFSEIISSISDVKFSNSGRYMISRDYLSVKVWDLHMETKPIETYTVHEYLRSKLCSLYENDCIFDKFECCMSHTGEHIASGSYSNTLRVFGTKTGEDELLEASMTPTNVHGASEPARTRSPRFASLFGKGTAEPEKRKELDLGTLNCYAKVRHMQWHPNTDLLSVARGNEIYMLCDVPGVGAFN